MADLNFIRKSMPWVYQRIVRIVQFYKKPLGWKKFNFSTDATVIYIMLTANSVH